MEKDKRKENKGEERETEEKDEERGRKEKNKIFDVPMVEARRSEKLKLVHATRATRGYQNLGVSSNSKR